MDDYIYTVNSRMKKKHKFKLDKQLTDFLEVVMMELDGDLTFLEIRTEHKRHGCMFRGSPMYHNKIWRDWVMVKWDEIDELLPAQIWCFLDLSKLKDGCYYDPGVYAVVESAKPNKSKGEQGVSQLFQPYVKERNGNNRLFYLVDVNAITETACIIPDIGNTSNSACLRLLPKTEWSNIFQQFLEEEDAAAGHFAM